MINGDFIHINSFPYYMCLLYFYFKLLYITVQGHHMMVLVIRVELSVALLYQERQYICLNKYFAQCLYTRNLVLF